MKSPDPKRPNHPRSHDVRGDDGSALPAVLIILTVITTIVGAMLAVRLAQFRLVQRDIHAVQAYYAAEGSLERVRAELERDPTWRPVEGHLGSTLARREPCEAPGVQCTVRVTPFGGYALVSARASVGRAQRTLRAFVGSVAPPALENALVLGGSSPSLTLAGGAQVAGNVVLHDGSLSQGVLPGDTRQGTFRGEVYSVRADRPETSWPSFQDRMPRATLNRLEATFRAEASKLEEIPPAARRWRHEVASVRAEAAPERTIYSGKTTLKRDDKAQIVRVPESLDVTARDRALFETPVSLYVRGNLTVRGPLTLPAGTELVALDTLHIRGAVGGPGSLLYGGHLVHLRGWAGGAAQVLSRGEVRVDGPAHLTYPSTIYVGGEGGGMGEAQWQRGDDRSAGEAQPADTFRPARIELGRGAIVDGTLLSPSALRDAAGRPSSDRWGTDKKQIVVIGEGALLRGVLYSANRARIEGSVYGTVVAQEHYLYRSPTRYVNWIAGGRIHRDRRPPRYVAPMGFARGAATGPGAGPEHTLRLIRLSERDPFTRPEPGHVRTPATTR